MKHYPLTYAISRSRLPILLLLAAATLLLGSSCGDDGPTGGGDKTPPTVISTNPADNATGVSVNPTIEIAFSEKLVANSVSGSVSISPTVNLAVTITDSLIGIAIVGGSLDYSTTYTITASTDITDLAGNHLAQAFEMSFTTEIDPNTLPATLVSTTPTNGATDVSVSQPLSATFSKGMDSATTAAAFTIDNGITGTVQVSGGDVIFTPDTDLAYSTTYAAAISTAAQDTFGINLASAANWSFTTEPDPATPVVMITAPSFDAIVGDTFTITSTASSSAGIDSVQYQINGFPIGSATAAPYQLDYSLPGAIIGQGFQLTAKAYAESQGQTVIGNSSQVQLWYQWILVGEDNPSPAEYLKAVWARSSDSVVELRFEYWDNWNTYPYPKDTIVTDTMGNVDTIRLGDDTFAFALYLDSDQQTGTGRSYLGNPPDTVHLNGVGADYRVLVGLFGGDTCFSAYNFGTQTFDLVSDTTGLASHSVPPDTNVFVIGIRWSDLGGSTGLDMLAINADFSAGAAVDPTFDYMPDLGSFVITVLREDRYIGPLESKTPFYRPSAHRGGQQATPVPALPNPFD